MFQDRFSLCKKYGRSAQRGGPPLYLRLRLQNAGSAISLFISGCTKTHMKRQSITISFYHIITSPDNVGRQNDCRAYPAREERRYSAAVLGTVLTAGHPKPG